MIELWACPEGDAAYAVQAGALVDESLAAAVNERALAAERKHRASHPEHFA